MPCPPPSEGRYTETAGVKAERVLLFKTTGEEVGVISQIYLPKDLGAKVFKVGLGNKGLGNGVC